MNRKKAWKIFKIIWFSLVGIFFVWNWSTFQARDLPAGTFRTDDTLVVQETDDQIIFKPRQGGHSLAVIFFQGGLADPKAYGPLCRKVAAAGYPCHLIKMSFRLPQRDYQKISTLFDLQAGQYVIGGHSQGGKMAAQFVWEHPTAMQGLFLMGTSHPRCIDLSSLDIPTLKFYAENDGLASVEEVLENKDKLPANTEMIPIAGGNHSHFGYLGTLFMDDRATITTAQQQALVADGLISFLERVRSGLLKAE